MKKTELLKYIDNFNGQHLAVLGDLMLDKYIWGGASRISQEAPVPVVHVSRENSVPGGAANVARNALSLGGRVELFGITGSDFDGNELKAQLENNGADVSGVIAVNDRPTTVKTRVLANNQQVVRIDYEKTDSISSAVRRKMRMKLEKAVQGGMKALILEDYAKGIFSRDFMQNIVNYANEYGVITTLDPHPNNAFNVKGLFLMTPNRREAFALAGMKYVPGIGNPLKDKALHKVANVIRKLWGPRHLLVTLGAEGMALFSEGAAVPVHIPTKARQVFDVSGAGDTVMATMVMALLAGADVVNAAQIANHAAGVVVGMIGTAAIEKDVLKAAILDE